MGGAADAAPPLFYLHLLRTIADSKCHTVSNGTYTYDDWGNVETATTEAGVKYEFEYDTYGNNTLVKIVSGNVSIQSQAYYTDDGNRLEWTKDALDKQTTYCYNENTNVLGYAARLHDFFAYNSSLRPWHGNREVGSCLSKRVSILHASGLQY